MESEWIKHGRSSQCPVDEEQPVEVRWWHHEGTTKHRAGAFNWYMVSAYRVLPKPAHAR